ncbi:stage III sporulation protein AA [Cohnella massiliensis]|uniref:stage III sporulation protein AA n=1 Tax=Cohnella massiliensis TaxID=1816691 RepID=UPI0009BA0225|nr:stage III sporulation protein AA [Cohnella massiliensis]
MAPNWLDLMPSVLRSLLAGLPQAIAGTLEEIRIRENRPLEIGYGGRYGFVRSDGSVTGDFKSAYKPDRDQCRALLETITNHSLYAVEEELRRGYVTVSGGHRIGLVGRTVTEGGAVRQVKDIAGFNVRIARPRVGCAAAVLPGLLDQAARTVKHTLIVSPPQHGKTTLLRDMARAVSSGEWGHPQAAGWGGRKVGIVDERSEIAASERGIPTFDLGPRTDVLDACPKAEGIMMMIRSMSPEVIVVDEIGRGEDAYALREALHAGVRVIATAHAAGLDDVLMRPVLSELARDRVFGAYVLLSRQGDNVRHLVYSDRDADEKWRGGGTRSRASPRDAPPETEETRSGSAAGSPGGGGGVPRPFPSIRSPSRAEDAGREAEHA